MVNNELTMVYPENFKARVLKAYPKFPHLAQSMEEGECKALGNFLKAWCRTPSWDMILKASSLEKIQEIARDEQERLDLFDSWINLFVSEHPEIPLKDLGIF